MFSNYIQKTNFPVHTLVALHFIHWQFNFSLSIHFFCITIDHNTDPCAMTNICREKDKYV